jgi:hypothetical protein
MIDLSRVCIGSSFFVYVSVLIKGLFVYFNMYVGFMAIVVTITCGERPRKCCRCRGGSYIRQTERQCHESATLLKIVGMAAAGCKNF